MTATREMLPGLDDEFALDDGLVAAYRRDGHVVLRGVCSPQEVDYYRPVFAEEVARRSANYAPLAERDTYGKAFLQIMNLWRDDERFKRFVFARRFAGIAARLLGVEGVRLYHDQALFKEGGGGATPWHQDQHYWPLETDNTVTMWMPLVDITENMGTMTFASGSQHAGYLGDLPISDESDRRYTESIARNGFRVINHGAMSAGDATFHSGWVFHSAPGNETARTREVMTIIYYPDGTRVMKPDNANRQADLDQWIPGGIPGNPAASPINPVLYSAR